MGGGSTELINVVVCIRKPCAKKLVMLDVKGVLEGAFVVRFQFIFEDT